MTLLGQACVANSHAGDAGERADARPPPQDAGQVEDVDASRRADADGVGDATADAGDAWLSLIEHTRWQNALLDEDPLAHHQPDEIACDLAGWLLERGMLEIDTGRCNYLWLEQPAERAVRTGDRLRMQLLHFNLTAPEPARAHFALLFGDEAVAEEEVDIPHDAQALELEWTSERDLARGERIGLHLHNHGQNTWLLADIQVRN